MYSSQVLAGSEMVDVESGRKHIHDRVAKKTARHSIETNYPFIQLTRTLTQHETFRLSLSNILGCQLAKLFELRPQEPGTRLTHKSSCPSKVFGRRDEAALEVAGECHAAWRPITG